MRPTTQMAPSPALSWGIAQSGDDQLAQEGGQVLGVVGMGTLGYRVPRGRSAHRPAHATRREKGGGRTAVEGKCLGILLGLLFAGVGGGVGDAAGLAGHASQVAVIDTDTYGRGRHGQDVAAQSAGGG